MATKPKVKTLTNSSVDVLNAIRHEATINYQNKVPIATADADSIRTIGAVIMDAVALQNEFLSALVNRIGRVMVSSRLFDNPLKMFKRGILEYGEVVEDIFVNIAKPFTFDPETAEAEVFKREIPDVKSTFYVMNYQKFYKTTISADQLRQAFLSWDGVIDLIGRIVDSMYSGANYDEWLTTKYMIARKMLNGEIASVTIATPSEATAKTIGTSVRGLSNDFEFPKTIYNTAKVLNKSDKNDQYLIMKSEFDAFIDVNLLSAAFNMDKAEFLGHRLMIDGFDFSDDEIARLGEVFAGNTTYEEIGTADNAELKKVQAILIDKDFLMIFDNMMKFTEVYNGQGLYWNEFLHRWVTFAASPFANAAMLQTGNPQVTSVTVSPTTATAKQNAAYAQNIQLTAIIETTDFAPQAVKWTSDTEGVTVSAAGLVTIPANTKDPKVVITATSVFDTSKTGTCTITLT